MDATITILVCGECVTPHNTPLTIIGRATLITPVPCFFCPDVKIREGYMALFRKVL